MKFTVFISNEAFVYKIFNVCFDKNANTSYV